MRILIVEDEKLQKKTLKMILEYHGHEVVAIDNGIDMVEQLSEDHFDLVITDIGLPGISGLDATRYVKKKLHITTPIIGVSGLDIHDPILKKCIGVFECFIRKPIPLMELDDAIEKIREEHDRHQRGGEG